MSQFILLRGARQLITLAGPEGIRCGPTLHSLSVIPDGSVLIEDGAIVEVGSTRRIENLKHARHALELDVHGSVVMPGFVDAGLRIALNANSGGARRPKRMGQLYDDTLELLRSCVLNGTLTAELKGTAALDDYRSDLGVLRRLAKLGNGTAGTVRCWQLARLPRSDEETAEFAETLNTLSRKGLVHFVELPIGDDACLSEPAAQCVQTSGVSVKVLWKGSDPKNLSHVIQQVRPVSVFCTKPLTQPERLALQGYRGVVIFAPGPGMGDATLTAARGAIDAGLGVALSSGYDAESYPAYSMQMAVSLATVYGLLSLEEAITAATLNAAHAIGCGATHGCLMKGRRADILVLNVPDYREIPRQFGINNVRMALRDGQVVMNRGGWKMGTHEAPPPDRVRTQRVGGS